MPETQCVAPINGTRLRLTRLSSCGVPVVGPCSTLVTDGFISVKVTPQYEAGKETTVKNAGGRLAIYNKAPDVLKHWDVEVTLVGVNPDALEMMAGYEAVVDYNGDTVGIDYGEDLEASLGVAVEVWTDIANQDCTTGVERFGYLLLPWTLAYRVTSDVTIQEDVLNAVVTGQTKRNSGWGTGPYDVEQHAALVGPPAVPAAPGPLLTPIGAKTHMRLITTIVPPPDVPAECGCFALA